MRSSCVYAVKVLVLGSLEVVGEHTSDLTEVDLSILGLVETLLFLVDQCLDGFKLGMSSIG